MSDRSLNSLPQSGSLCLSGGLSLAAHLGTWGRPVQRVARVPDSRLGSVSVSPRDTVPSPPSVPPKPLLLAVTTYNFLLRLKRTPNTTKKQVWGTLWRSLAWITLIWSPICGLASPVSAEPIRKPSPDSPRLLSNLRNLPGRFSTRPCTSLCSCPNACARNHSSWIASLAAA